MPDTRAPRWLKPINKIYMVLMRRGVHFGAEHPLVLTAPGRKTGKLRSTPVTPMEIDGQRYIVAVFPEADWVANVRAAAQATLTDKGNTERVELVELPAADVGPVLRQFPVQVPAGVAFLKNAGLVTTGTPEELQGLAGVLPVFRVDAA
jgi:deazaflavin-dependent oxidoreductase (nitroreductase family)